MTRIEVGMMQLKGFVFFFCFFFFNDTATTEIYTLSLHDALPISASLTPCTAPLCTMPASCQHRGDRKSTRLNSSHGSISYAVFCLKKKKKYQYNQIKKKKKIKKNKIIDITKRY